MWIRGAVKLFDLVKKGDLEGLVMKRKNGKYSQHTLWYKILNPTYTQKTAGRNFFKDSNPRLPKAVTYHNSDSKEKRFTSIGS